MAEETDQEAEARRQLEEYQRQQAAAALEASRNQPNAIPAEPVRAVDRAVQAAPTNGQYITGSTQGNIPFVDTHNRPRSEWGTPANVPESSAYRERGLIPGGYDDRSSGILQGSPLSQGEQTFWAANPMGAVPHPVTGELIGLGSNQTSRQLALEGITPPDQLAASRLPPPQFLQIPQVDPSVVAQRRAVQNDMDATRRQLATASTQSPGRGLPSQANILGERLSKLSHAYHGLSLTEHQQMQSQNEVTKQNSKMQNEYTVARDSQSAQIALGRITAQPGTDEYKKAVARIYFDHPYATEDQHTAAALLKASTFHDERESARKRAEAAGLIVKETGYGQKGPTEKYIDPNAVPDKVKTRYDKVQGQINKHLEASDIEKTTINKNKADQPYSKAPDLHAFQSEAVSLEQQYPGLKPKAEATPTVTPAAFDYSKIPSGSIYTDPNGVRRRKP